MKSLKTIVCLGLILGIQTLNASEEQATCTANAGGDKILYVTPSKRSVYLNGKGSTVTPGAGEIISYKWYKGSSYLGSGAARWYTPTSKFQQISLIIKTSTGCTDEDVINVTAISTPHANAGEDITATITPSNTSVTLDGGASTPGANFSHITSYKWTDVNGTTLGEESILDFTPPNDVNATYPITLTVTNDSDRNDSDTVNVKVKILNTDPGTSLQADAGEDKVLNVTPSHRAVYLNGSNSFGVNGIVSYKWYDGTTYIGSHKKRWYAPNEAGVHDIKLVVIDAQGNTDEDHMNLNVVIP